mmetsp:Transcript_33640/g.61991  ORF Transcript_33640/g.61991 Transcript_33640/m.61991 type:complete len:305 (+) Transcript_33640:146-1060(+)
MTSETIEVDQIALLSDRINAMRSQEENTSSSSRYNCHNYLNSQVDATCRKAMVDWCFTVAKSFEFSRETVGIAITSILDRYLSSSSGSESSKTAEVAALRSKQVFQLAAITALYMAIKIFEPVQLGIDMIIKICRGAYKESDIYSMERDILFSLEWRVCIATTTPMEYVRHFSELLLLSSDWGSGIIAKDDIIQHAVKYADRATNDIYFSTCRTSAVGAACLAGALNDVNTLSIFEKKILWRQLNRKLDFELDSLAIKHVEQRLLSTTTLCCEPKSQPCASTFRSNVKASCEQPLSPRIVVQGL